MKILILGAGPDMIIRGRYTNGADAPPTPPTPTSHLASRNTNGPDITPFVYWNQTWPELSQHRTSQIFFFALSAASIYTHAHTECPN